MEEKLRFIFEHELQERTMTELCERYEITRQTGYVWLRRHREAGVDGLITHSRATSSIFTPLDGSEVRAPMGFTFDFQLSTVGLPRW